MFSMNLKTLAVLVVVLGLAFMTNVERVAVPDAIWLAVWGLGLIAVGTAVRDIPHRIVDKRRVEQTPNFKSTKGKLAQA
jgi:hypothetical protein